VASIAANALGIPTGTGAPFPIKPGSPTKAVPGWDVQVLGADEKRLHIFVTIARGEEVVATIEQMCLHVDIKAGKTCPAAPEVLAKLKPIAEAHTALPRPEGAGRAIGQKPGGKA
jgi:hypothetical protein